METRHPVRWDWGTLNYNGSRAKKTASLVVVVNGVISDNQGVRKKECWEMLFEPQGSLPKSLDLGQDL